MKWLTQLFLKLLRSLNFSRDPNILGFVGGKPVYAVAGAAPTYNEQIGAGDLYFPPEETTKIWQAAIEQSAVLQSFQRTTMSSKQKRVPVMTAFPIAYWTSTGALKQTSKMAWEGKFIEAEELAVIIPIPENVLDDAFFDIWGEVRPRAAEAIARKLDQTVFFGAADAPGTFPDPVVPAAVTAENWFNIGSHTAVQGGVAEDLNQVFGLVEADGYDVTRLVAERRFRAMLRGARDGFGNRLMDVGPNGATVLDTPVTFAMPGLWPDFTADSSARGVVFDGTQFVVGIRQDISMKLLTEAVISDDTGKVIMNLAQQDMVALRVTFRAGWQVPNPITHENEDEATRYPAAVLRNAPPAGP